MGSDSVKEWASSVDGEGVGVLLEGGKTSVKGGSGSGGSGSMSLNCFSNLQ